MANLLVVSAVIEELGGLEGEAVGVGLVRAAIGASRALDRHRPRAILLLGSAGAYPGGPPAGTVVCAARLGLETGISELGRGYVPMPAPVLDTDAGLREVAGLPCADVLTVQAVTTDPELVARRAGGWTVEHMEAYAVVAAAQAAGVPALVVLGIANEVGPQAHAQWIAGRQQAERAAQAAVERIIQRLGEGAAD